MSRILIENRFLVAMGYTSCGEGDRVTAKEKSALLQGSGNVLKLAVVIL